MTRDIDIEALKGEVALIGNKLSEIDVLLKTAGKSSGEDFNLKNLMISIKQILEQSNEQYSKIEEMLNI